MPRAVFLVLGVLLGVAGTLGIQHALKRYFEGGCNSVATTKLSPDGGMRATLTTKGCDYGFGLAANFATVHIEKLGDNGWFMDVPLNSDQPSGNVEARIDWNGNDLLQATVVSHDYSGSIEERVQGFRFVQTYVHNGAR